MKQRAKKIIIIPAAIILIIAAGLLGYRIVKKQGPVETRIINGQESGSRVLIMTQSSGFKDEVIRRVEKNYGGKAVYIEISDIISQASPAAEDWDSIILFSTVESGDLYPEALEKVKLLKQNIGINVFIINTADSETWKHNDMNIDAYTSTSRSENIDRYVSKISGLIDSVI